MGALHNKGIIAKEEALSHIIPDQINHLVSDVDVQGQLVMAAGDEGCLYRKLGLCTLLLSSPS